jgi:hypothetical protein
LKQARQESIVQRREAPTTNAAAETVDCWKENKKRINFSEPADEEVVTAAETEAVIEGPQKTLSIQGDTELSALPKTLKRAERRQTGFKIFAHQKATALLQDNSHMLRKVQSHLTQCWVALLSVVPRLAICHVSQH